MIYSGCQSKSKELSIIEKTCPKCGHTVELFSIDTEIACEHCGTIVYNDTLSCVQWCKYAKACVGDEMHASMMRVLEARRKKAREENGLE